MKNRIALTLIALLAACAPAQPPAARGPSETETQLFLAPDLSPLNNEFTDGIGKLSWLDPEGVNAPSVKDSYLMVRNTDRTPVWFEDGSGTMLYAYVSGDFMVESKLTSNLLSDITKRSDSRFTSAGLAVRDPASTAGNMRWMVFNVGSQDGFFGTEVKTTRVEGSSSSTWFSNRIEGSSNEAQLRICRIGPELRFFLKPAGTTNWTEEMNSATTVRSGSSTVVPGVTANSPLRFQRSDLPAVLQVGLMTNDINVAGTGEGRFDYLRFQRINNFENCTK
jgi:hypothetical protein